MNRVRGLKVKARGPNFATRRTKVLGGLAACAVMGPLTGPLTLGLVSCVRAKRPWMASVYALGIVEVLVGLPLLLKAELEWLAAFN